MLSSVPEDAVIVRSIIDLAHNLSLEVVAEGVEDEETMKLLMGYGCDTAQGYFFSRPVPQQQLGEWLASSQYGVPRRLPRGSGRRLRCPRSRPDTQEVTGAGPAPCRSPGPGATIGAMTC